MTKMSSKMFMVWIVVLFSVILAGCSGNPVEDIKKTLEDETATLESTEWILAEIVTKTNTILSGITTNNGDVYYTVMCITTNGNGEKVWAKYKYKNHQRVSLEQSDQITTIESNYFHTHSYNEVPWPGGLVYAITSDTTYKYQIEKAQLRITNAYEKKVTVVKQNGQATSTIINEAEAIGPNSIALVTEWRFIKKKN